MSVQSAGVGKVGVLERSGLFTFLRAVLLALVLSVGLSADRTRLRRLRPISKENSNMKITVQWATSEGNHQYDTYGCGSSD